MKINSMEAQAKQLILCAFTILVSHSLFGQDYSMQEAIQYARENHNEVKRALLEISDADGNIKEFTAIGMPKITGGVELQHFIDIPTSIIPQGSFFAGDPDQNLPPNPIEDLEVQFGVKNILTASLSADALLFDGSFLVGLQAARQFKELVSKQAEATKENMAIDVAKSYLGVLVAMKNREILLKNIDNLESTYNESSEIYAQGFIEKLDLDRLEFSINSLKAELDKLDGAMEISKNVLKFSMGYPLAEEITLTESIDDLILSEYDNVTMLDSEVSYTDHAEFEALQKAQELNDLNVRRLKMMYVPTLRGFASYSQVLQGNQFARGVWFPTSLVGATLNVPIYDGNEKKSKIARARIDKEQHQLTIEDMERAIDLQVENAKKSLTNAMRSVETSERNEALAQNIYDTALIKYREGVGASLEVTQAEADLFRAQGNLINDLYDVLIAKVELQNALGNL